jgi:hypothetical protein
MIDWLVWPAQLLLNAGGTVAGWFVSRDAISFLALQMGFALVVLATIVYLFVFLQSLVRYWRSRPRANRPS